MLKKNIAKLLVFAMILSMLPFSAVTVGAEEVTGKVGKYVTVSTAKAGTYDLDWDTTSSSFGMKTEDVLNAGKTTIAFTAEISKDGENKAAGLKIWYTDGYFLENDTEPKAETKPNLAVNNSGSYTVSDDTSYAVTCDIDLTAETKELTFTLIPIDKDGNDLSHDDLKLKVNVATQSVDPAKNYSIELDSSVKVKVGESKTLTPKLKYGGEDVTKNASFTYQILNDAKTVKLDGGTITGANEGSAKILVSAYVNSKDVAVKTAEVSVTVEAAEQTNKQHTITYTSNPDNGTVKVEAEDVTGDVVSNSTKVTVGKKVTITAAPTDSTVYALNMDTFGVYKLSDDTEAAKYESVGNNAYTFTMPDCDVKITATFIKEKEEGNLIHAVAIKMDTEDLYAGYAVPQPTTTTQGVKLSVEWKNSKNEVEEVAFDDGEREYNYTITPTAETGYVIADDATYTFNGKDVELDHNGKLTGSVSIAVRNLRAAWTRDGVVNVAGGKLAIDGTRADRSYVVEVIKFSGEASSNAYLVMDGGTKGYIEFPCSRASSVNIWETKNPNVTYGNLGKANITGKVIELKGDIVFQDTENTEDKDSGESTKPTGIWTRTGITNVAGGLMTIANAHEGSYYVIEVIRFSGEASSNAYLVIRCGADKKVQFPCSRSSSVNIWETDNPNVTYGNLGKADISGKVLDMQG